MLRSSRPRGGSRLRRLAVAVPLVLAIGAPAAQANPIFSPQSVWNQPLAANAPLAANSSSQVAKLNAWTSKEISTHYGPSINTTAYSSPVYTVPAGQPTTKVVLEQNVPLLYNAFAAVPIPSNAQVAAGTDQHMVVYQPSSDTMWEFWHMCQCLRKPTGLSAAVATGGSLPAATDVYSVSVLGTSGETAAGPAGGKVVTVPASSKVTISWTGIVGATGYRVYRAVQGGTAQLIGQVSTPTTAYGTKVSFVDAGTAAAGGVAPQATSNAVTPGVWHANWGGRILNVSQDPGHYRNVVNASGAKVEDKLWGSTASSLPMVAGMMMISELQAGHIDHALQMGLPDTKASSYLWPAQRTDGGDKSVDAIPEGARFRLDPALDLSKLSLPPMTRMMAVAAQKYGIVVNDKTYSTVTFRGEDPTPMMRAGAANPYTALYAGTPSYSLLAKFPWSSLQLLAVPSNPW